MTRGDQEQMMPDMAALARGLAQTYKRHEGALRQTFRETKLSDEVWRFDDLALCVLDEAEKMTRSTLVEGGQLPDVKGRIFWGREELAEAGLEQR